MLAALKQEAPRLASLRVWEAYARLDALPENAQPLTELTALGALIRRACGLDAALTSFDAQGGLGKMFQFFGDQINPIIDELNGNLVA